MDTAERSRAILGFLLTPLGAVLALVVSGAVIATARGQSFHAMIGDAPSAAFFFAFFGLPIAYFLELVVGLSVYAPPTEPPGACDIRASGRWENDAR